MRRLALALVLLVPAMCVSAQEAALSRTLVVSGSAQVSAPPDLATVNAGVETAADTAAEAMASNGAAMARVIAVLEAAGLAPEDYQTTGFDVSEIWEDGGGPDGRRGVTGYRVSNALTIRVRDVAAVGGLIDALSAAGANRFHSLVFSVDDPQPFVDAARRDAVAEARRKAELYAGAAGVTLGPVLTLREGGRGFDPEPFAAPRAEAAMDTPIAAGSVRLGADVEIVYAIE